MNIIFISWDGPQVSYLENLFLPIFNRLKCFGYKFHILHFTWGEKKRIKLLRNLCESSGVPYHSKYVWRQPVGLGALFTALTGSKLIRKLAREWSIDILMPRSNLPALSCLLTLKNLNLPIVFDADGLPLDERIDFTDASPSSIPLRFLRDIEAEMVRRADIVLTRSLRASHILNARAGAGTAQEKFHVVTNGRDTHEFCPVSDSTRRATRHEICIDVTAPLLVYAGSLGKQYCLEEMLLLFESVRHYRQDARLLILSGSPEIALSALALRPSLESATVVKKVPASEVHRYLACADLGLALRRPSFSMQAVSPIKLGEYLLCGLPIVATMGVGDTNFIDENSGFLISELTPDQLNNAAKWFCMNVLKNRGDYENRCRSIGINFFSLDKSTNDYLLSLQSLPSKITTANNKF